MPYTSLHDRLRGPITKALKKELGISNVHALPRIEKVVLNVGINKTKMDGKEWQEYVEDCLARIAGQKPVTTKARKAISNFKIRQGLAVGSMVTLRGRRMEDFLDRFLSYALPRIRDFRGTTTRLDGRGNYSLGIADHSIFPEAPAPDAKQIFGLQVQITTTTDSDDEARVLLKHIGMPFQPEKKGRDEERKERAEQEAKKARQLREEAMKEAKAAKEEDASQEGDAKKDAESVDSEPSGGDNEQKSDSKS